jgi:RimJ/RimL family protein N-acetyltransferase
MDIKPTSLKKPFNLPPPVYTCIPIAVAVSHNGDRFTITAGLDRGMVEQLAAHSTSDSDIDLQNNTSDRHRFGEGSYEQWYVNDRMPFALVEQSSGALAAIVWYGPKPVGVKPFSNSNIVKPLAAGSWATFAYRSYPPFRGKGLMKDFVKYAQLIYGQHFPQMKLWGGIMADNAPSLGLAQSLGFRISEELSDRQNGWLVVIAPAKQNN